MKVTLPNKYRVNGLSPTTRQRIAECTTDGNGLHFDLCKVANSLRHDVDEDTGVEILFNLAVERGYNERKARYHANQLRKKWHETETAYRPTVKVKPDIDRIRRTVNESNFTVQKLASLSPVKVDQNDETAADDIVDLLLPGEIICATIDRFDAYCGYHRDFSDPMSKAQFIVPNPMRTTGQYESGKPSPRCQANVLYRRWVVLEFDISPFARDSKTPTIWRPLIGEWDAQGVSVQDAQARLIQGICGYEFDLAMVVFSGSKSLHSWWAVAGADERQIEAFIQRATKLGADPAARVTCQLFRMPAGWNQKEKTRQPVLYIDPQVLTNNSK